MNFLIDDDDGGGDSDLTMAGLLDA